MPSQVKIIRERNSTKWDDLVRDVISRQAYGVEHEYYGITNPDRAARVYRAIRTAGAHLGVGRKVYYRECPAPGKCKSGGPDCTHHVYYTIYDLDVARDYKAKQAQNNAAGRR